MCGLYVNGVILLVEHLLKVKFWNTISINFPAISLWDRLLIALSSQQSVVTAQWYSNKMTVVELGKPSKKRKCTDKDIVLKGGRGSIQKPNYKIKTF